MSSRLIPAILAACALAQAAPALTEVAPTSLGAHTASSVDFSEIRVNLDDATGPMYFLQLSADDFKTLPFLLGPFPLDQDGNGFIASPFSMESILPPNVKIAFRAIYLGAKVQTTNIAAVVLNSEGCVDFDFDITPGGGTTVNGEIATNQWAAVGVNISAESQPPLAINTAVIFDSSFPQPQDPDLITPGYGPGNDTPLGNLLIIAENLVDANNDGLIDSPDDAYNGGLMIFKFDEPKNVCSATLVDIDEEPGSGIWRLRFYQDHAATQQITAITVPPMGDNSVQTLHFYVQGVRRMDVKMGGSGGLAAFSACPTCIDWDQDTFGKPLNLATGEVITNQLQADYGFVVSAVNQTPGHPNKAIIFDTANPTGGDTDLAAPGYGIGNNVALGKILIIAENDVDANLDGLVDDPDDEQNGGRIFLDFDFDVRIGFVTLIDVDGPGPTRIDCLDANNNLLSSTPVADLGDNSVQKIPIGTAGVRRLRIVAGGSMGLVDLCYCPDVK